jgi:hypothetical protein
LTTVVDDRDHRVRVARRQRHPEVRDRASTSIQRRRSPYLIVPTRVSVTPALAVMNRPGSTVKPPPKATRAA